MNKYIQCMKSNNKNNIRLYTILFLLCYMVIEINNYKNNNFSSEKISNVGPSFIILPFLIKMVLLVCSNT